MRVLASDSLRLLALGEEGERWSTGMWTRDAIERWLLRSIAPVVQRGDALTMLAAYTKATHARAEREEWAGTEGIWGMVQGRTMRKEVRLSRCPSQSSEAHKTAVSACVIPVSYQHIMCRPPLLVSVLCAPEPCL